MAVDYDLVVIGSSWVGLYAASKAAQLQARVALVTQSRDLLLPNDTLNTRTLSELGRENYQLKQIDIDRALASIASNTTQDLFSRTNLAMEPQSLAALAALGVDVIVDRGEFCRLPKLAFQTAKRKLRSRKFLLATGTNFVPEFANLEPHDYLTLRQLWQTDLAILGEKIILVGGNPTALELAQALARLGKKVALITAQPRILPQEDLEPVLLLQAQLEAEGVEIYTNAPISQIKTIAGQKWLQAGDRALAATEIIIADFQQPNVTGLNLTGVGVTYDKNKVRVNSRLQTSNSDIYACGSLIGGYNLPSIARYEANVVLKNTLFLPLYRVNYCSLPWMIGTQPNFARIGLTSQQARQRYGDKLYQVQEYFADLERSPIFNSSTGMCKLLIRSNGEIVGCSLIGDRAEELITSISIMMQHRIRLKSNPMRGLTSLSLPTTYLSLSSIWQRVWDNFYQQKLQRNPQLSSRLQGWFTWLKKWHR
ncbi:MAG: NAD(P)/FAD-dependent oxidoreductase [Cyanobacteria bacterium J06633_1]